TGVQTCALPIFIIFFSRQKKISMESDRRFANSIDLRFPFDISQRIQKNIHFSYSRNVKFAVFILKKPMFLPAKEKQITTAANPFHRSFVIFGRFDGDQVILRPQKYNGGWRSFPDIV